MTHCINQGELFCKAVKPEANLKNRQGWGAPGWLSKGSSSQGYEFEAHVGYRDYLNK